MGLTAIVRRVTATVGAALRLAPAQAAVLPRIGPYPGPIGRLLVAAVVVAVVVAWPLSLDPTSGMPGRMEVDSPGTISTWWLYQHVGALGMLQSRYSGYPVLTDWVSHSGAQADAFLAWPFLELFGWPAGFTLATVAAIAGCAASMGWLAGCVWRSEVAGLAGGVAWAASSVLVRELDNGRITQVLASAFAPLAVGYFLRALDRRTDRDAALAGALAAWVALLYWFWGLFLVLGLLVVVALATLERRAWIRVSLVGGLAAALVAGPALIYTLATVHTHTGVGLTPWSPVDDGRAGSRPLVDLMEMRDLTHAGIRENAVGLRPLAAVLGILAVVLARRRRWLLPLTWLLVGVLFSLGPWIPAPAQARVPGPFLFIAESPVLGRLWWPDRYLLLAGLGSSLLVAGGAHLVAEKLRARAPRFGAALPFVLAGLLLGEAWLTHPALPLSVTPVPGERAAVMARRSGPLLVLPVNDARGFVDFRPLVELPWVQRPVVNGQLAPESDLSSVASRELWGLAGMTWLADCERDPKATVEDGELDAATAAAQLAALGLDDVYLDPTAPVPDAPAYTRCIEQLLGPGAEEPPLVRYSLVAAAHSTGPSTP